VKNIEVINSFFYLKIPRYCLSGSVENWVASTSVSGNCPSRERA